MQIMHISSEFEASAADAWNIVSDFGNLGAWNPAILECSLDHPGVGGIRTFTTSAATVRERLLEWDATTLTMDYEIVSGSAMKVRDARLRLKVVPQAPARCAVAWDMWGEPDGVDPDALRAQAEQRYRGRFEDLRRVLCPPR